MNEPGNADVLVGINEEWAGRDTGAPRDASGWCSRGYLPHCDAQHPIQSITFRLADSLPQTKLVE